MEYSANNVKMVGGIIKNCKAAIAGDKSRLYLGDMRLLKIIQQILGLILSRYLLYRIILREMQVCLLGRITLHFPVELRLLGYQNLCLAGLLRRMVVIL